MNIVVEKLGSVPIFDQKTEIVERKGLGHPDFICDSIVDRISVALSKEYMKRFGQILHHNIDKALLAAGEAKNKFGGGKVLKPMKMIIGDRATYFVGNEEIDVSSIAIKTAKDWLKENLRFLDVEKHVEYQVELKHTSSALAEIFKKKDEVLGANDTSAVVGYAPLTPTEKIVLETEKFLNSKKFKKEHPESGEDIKVMGVRDGNNIRLTVAAAFVAPLTPDRETYESTKRQVAEFIRDELAPRFTSRKVEVFVNTADTEESAYLTVTGTSAESGDDGQVGRGNRASGLITPYRPMTLEAVAGKNPVSHVGKVYSIMTQLIAQRIAQAIPEVKQVYCYMVSQIGKPITDPQVVSVEVWGVPAAKVRDKVESVVDEVLGNWKQIRDGFINRQWQIY